MEYRVQFGRLNASAPKMQPNQKFRVGVLGDFSASGNLGRVEVGETLANRRPLRVNHENLDAILQRLNVQLKLPAGASGAMIDVPIRAMDDFHPDHLYENVPLFEKMMSLRQKLQDPNSFQKAASAVQALATPDAPLNISPVRSNSNQIPRRRIDSFADLLTQSAPPSEPAELKSLLRDAVGPHIVPDMQGQADYLAAVDQSLSDLMRRLLHHPDFQSLESLWRSLDLFLHRAELDEIEVVLYDINAAELAADLASSDQLDNTGLYHWLVEAPTQDANQGPLSVLICNFTFEKIPPHAELLARLAKIAAAAGAPALAGIDCAVLQKVAPEDEHPLIRQTWDMLRSQPESNYLGLVTPRYMLRWPYGKKTEPIDSFAFEEFTAKSGLSGMLWGNGSFLAGLLIAQTFCNDGLKGMKLGSVLTVDDLPFYYYNDAYGDQVALPCTERLVNVKGAAHLASQGFMPALAIQGRPEVRLGGLHSLCGQPLAGPWAPLTIGAGATAAAPVQSDLTSAAPVAAAAPTPAAPTPNVDDELDALLSSLDTPDPAAPAPAPAAPAAEAPAAPPAGEVDELDALLAGLDAADQQKAESTDEVDAELANLLAGL